MSKVVDYRKLSPEAQTQIRRAAMEKVQAGESVDTVAAALGCVRSAVFAWQQRFRIRGWAVLQTRPSPGAPARLEHAALLQVHDGVCGHTPDEYRLPGKLWTRASVGDLIERTFHIRYGLPQISHVLHPLGLSPQRPLYRAVRQDATAVECWRHEVFPGLVAHGRQRQAQIWFADESHVSTQHHSDITWGRQNETPVVAQAAEPFGWNLLAAISLCGECRFEVTARRGTATVFIAFLDKLRAGQERPILLIVDNHAVHHSKAVQAYVRDMQGRLELHFVPAYAPELNPDELVWNDLKTHGLDRFKFTNPFELKRLIETHLQRLQTMPQKIRSFFYGKPREYITQSGLLVTD